MKEEKNEADNYRYERKFLVKELSAKEIVHMLRFHPACFREIFHERWVNNIYFDTLGFNNYYDNVEGDRERWKSRIRWYGELFGKAEKPVLEFKIKKGLMGTKRSYKLAPFVMDKSFNEHTISKMLHESSIDKDVQHLLLSLNPSLMNRYRRRYFISADRSFRVTVDTDLTYYSLSTQKNLFLNHSVDHYTTVVELKYNSSGDEVADTISSYFPFMLTKSSKYLQGLERVLM